MSRPDIAQKERIQKVAFVRHGIARHNLVDKTTGRPPNPEDPALFDPSLVFEGKKQALQAGELLRTWWQTTQLGERIELVLTSPLTRCIQTAMLGFLPGDCYVDDKPEPLFLCDESIREAYGMHYADRRRKKSLLEVRCPLSAMVTVPFSTKFSFLF